MSTQPFEIILGTYEEFVLGYRVYPKSSEVTQTFATHTHASSVRCLAVSENLLASGGTDDRIVIYDLKQRKEHCILDHHDSTINCLAFTPDRSHILSGSADGVLAVTRVGNWQLEKIWKTAHKGSAVLDIAVHDSGKMALTLGADSTLRTWNLVKGRQAYIINLKSKCKDAKSLSVVKWAPCGTRFVLGGGKHAEIWSVETGGMMHDFEFDSKVICCGFIGDTKLITGHEDGKLNITIIDSGEKTTIEAHDVRIKALWAKEDSKYIVTASSNGDFKVFNRKKKYLEVASGKTGCRVTCLCLNPMGNLLDDNKKEEEVAEVVDLEKVMQQNSKIAKGTVVVEVEDDEDEPKFKKRKKKSKQI